MWQVANLIQKKSSFLCQFEKTGFTFLPSTGERTFFVAKEFGFQEIFRQGRTVDLNKGVFASVAVFMNEFGQKPLAGSGFSQNQYIGRLQMRKFKGQVEALLACFYFQQRSFGLSAPTYSVRPACP